jgi:hypothetical protein
LLLKNSELLPAALYKSSGRFQQAIHWSFSILWVSVDLNPSRTLTTILRREMKRKTRGKQQKVLN